MAGTTGTTNTVRRKPVAADDPEKDVETWEITTAGRVWLQVTSYTRHGQAIQKDVSLGPNKIGQKLKISRADREMNQENVTDPQFDPFVNGLLVRVDKPQDGDPATVSTDALTTSDLLGIYDLKGAAFVKAISALGQVPIRRLREMADAVDASASQMSALDDLIEERYRTAASQPDAVFDLSGQRRPEREGKE